MNSKENHKETGEAKMENKNNSEMQAMNDSMYRNSEKL